MATKGKNLPLNSVDVEKIFDDFLKEMDKFEGKKYPGIEKDMAEFEATMANATLNNANSGNLTLEGGGKNYQTGGSLRDVFNQFMAVLGDSRELIAGWAREDELTLIERIRLTRTEIMENYVLRDRLRLAFNKLLFEIMKTLAVIFFVYDIQHGRESFTFCLISTLLSSFISAICTGDFSGFSLFLSKIGGLLAGIPLGFIKAIGSMIGIMFPFFREEEEFVPINNAPQVQVVPFGPEPMPRELAPGFIPAVGAFVGVPALGAQTAFRIIFSLTAQAMIIEAAQIGGRVTLAMVTRAIDVDFRALALAAVRSNVPVRRRAENIIGGVFRFLYATLGRIAFGVQDPFEMGIRPFAILDIQGSPGVLPAFRDLLQVIIDANMLRMGRRLVVVRPGGRAAPRAGVLPIIPRAQALENLNAELDAYRARDPRRAIGRGGRRRAGISRKRRASSKKRKSSRKN